MSSHSSGVPRLGVSGVFFQAIGLSPEIPFMTLMASPEGPKRMTSYLSRSLAVSRTSRTEM